MYSLMPVMMESNRYIENQSSFHINSRARSRSPRRVTNDDNNRGFLRGGHLSHKASLNSCLRNRNNHQQHGEENVTSEWQNAPWKNVNNCRNGWIQRCKEKWGYKRLESLSTQNAEIIVEVLANHKNGFPSLIKKDLSIGEAHFLVQILAKICTYDDQEHVQSHLIAQACEPSFLQKLQIFTGKLLNSPPIILFPHSKGEPEKIEDKAETKISFLSNLHIFFNFITEKMPQTACEQLSNNINACNFLLLSSKSVYKFEFPQDLQDSFKSLKERFDQMTKDCSANRTVGEDQPYNLLSRLERQQKMLPPNDFRCISEVPICTDLLDFKPPFLRCNVVKGAYKNVDDYLDVQYRLLREDFIGPLREGIEEYLKSMLAEGKKRKTRFNNVRIYNSVRFISSAVEHGFIEYCIQFDLQNLRQVRWDSTKRLIFGSLLCLSNNGFKDIILASVQHRELIALQKGIVKIKLEGTTLPANIENSVYVMAESDGYFEAYRHVLSALKKYNADNFPMQRYIIKGEHNTLPPKYLSEKINSGGIYNLQCLKSLKNSINSCNVNQQIVPSVEKSFVSWNETDYLTTVNPLSLPVNVLNPLGWPSADFFNLDESQHHALKSALTQEFVVIQGPPGTGKTYIGLKIVQALLANSSVWNEQSCNRCPIFLVCYTNHALDQFLEGMLTFTHSVVRIGSRSKCDTLNNFNLSTLKKSRGLSFLVKRDVWDRVRSLRHEVKLFHEQYQAVEHTLDELRGQHGIVHDYLLIDNEIISREVYSLLLQQFPDVEDHKSVLRIWLGFPYRKTYKLWEGFGNPVTDNMSNDNYMESMDNDKIECDTEVVLEDEFYDANEDGGDERMIEVESEVSLSRDILMNQAKPNIIYSISYFTMNLELGLLIEQITILQQQGIRENIHPQLIENNLQPMKSRMNLLYAQINRLKITLSRWQPAYLNKENETNLVTHICNLNLIQRWQLYSHWIKKLEDKLKQKLSSLKKRYFKLQQLLTESATLENVHILRNSKIVGMTTTGAAKHNTLLTLLKPKIVVIEEAAEVLEAHIVTSLTKDCQHLILIGDHLQLRPSVSYRLGKNHFFNISLFERMVKNGMDCPKLQVQHRMRPEIANLIVPAIYPSLENDASVMDYPDIDGVCKNVFFLSHNEYEEQVTDTASRANRHEAEFIIQFTRYLILQGYDPSRITILTTYTGQLFLLRKLRRNYEMCIPVRVTVVDNYQGEENDIILLSLVRNNIEGSIGFLKTENRVCVALSRAKMGLYILGNINILVEHSHMWKKIQMVLESQNAVGTQLGLCCQVHNNITYVCKGDDFNSKTPSGGCTMLCESSLQCGHNCKMVCHPYDSKHEDYACKEPCKKLCKYDHPCRDLCWVKCKCVVMINKINTICFHKYDMPCHMDPAKSKCPKTCDILPPCGHKCKATCHVKNDPNHEDTKCIEKCVKKFPGCDHPCPKECWEYCGDCKIRVKKQLPNCQHEPYIPCHVDPCTIKCEKKCEKDQPCGHPCQNKCYQDCGPCKQFIDKTIPDCGHELIVKCSVTPTRDMCNKSCEMTLPCGHKCRKMCRYRCSPCPVDVTVDRITPCGHTIFVQCSEFLTANEMAIVELLKLCTHPCEMTTSCGHKCAGMCGKCYEGSNHVQCTENCNKNLMCGHECGGTCGKVCQPCRKECQYRCQHRKCGNDCGESCDKCMEPCGWKCEHTRCTKKCFEKCDREPCNETCRRILKCSHPCIGYCGEPCPSLCHLCNSDKLEDMSMGGKTDEPRYISLDCAHTINSDFMDKWMATEQETVGLKECPQCFMPIAYCPRYNNIIKASFRNIARIKRRLVEAPSEIKKKTSGVTSRIRQIEEMDKLNLTLDDIIRRKNINFHRGRAGCRSGRQRGVHGRLGSLKAPARISAHLQTIEKRKLNIHDARHRLSQRPKQASWYEDY